MVKHRDAFAPPEFEHDTSLRAREQEVTTLAKAGLQDVWVDIHCPTQTDIKDKESSCPTGFTYGYPREGERLDPQRLRRIDRIHTTPDLLSLTLAKAGLQDVWVDIHCPTETDIKDKESSCPTGITYGYPREGERLDPQRLRRIDRIHTTPDLLTLATSVYPMLAANSDHKAILAEFTHPSLKTKDTVPRFYSQEAILPDSEAMEDLETSLKSITSTGDQW